MRSGEVLKLRHHTGRVSKARVVRWEKLDRDGFEGPKYKVWLGHGSVEHQATLLRRHSPRRESGPYFYKKRKGVLLPVFYPEVKPTAMLSKYLRLQSLGLPVVPTLRSHRGVFMTWMVPDGHVLLDKHGVYSGNGDQADLRWLRYRDDLSERFVSMATRAYDQGNGVYLDADAYTLDVDCRSYTYEPRLLDIGVRSHLLSSGKSVHNGEPFWVDSAQHLAALFCEEILERVDHGKSGAQVG